MQPLNDLSGGYVKDRKYNIEMAQRALDFLISNRSKPYKLTGDDWKILIILASYSGPNGIYPKQKNLCKELSMSKRTLIRRLIYLASIGIIAIQKIVRINYYCLPFLYTPYSANLAPIIENWREKLHNRCQSDTRIGANLAPTLISYIDNNKYHVSKISGLEVKKETMHNSPETISSMEHKILGKDVFDKHLNIISTKGGIKHEIKK
jgi:hypothetical protein